MSAKQPLTYIAPPVPELPVTDVERAQQHYRDALGFTINWLEPDKEIGAVSRGDVAIFFRKRTPPFEPAIHWVFATDIDATYKEFQSLRKPQSRISGSTSFPRSTRDSCQPR